MSQQGLYHIALVPDADDEAFVSRIAELGDDGGDRHVVQLTRITTGFEARLLRRAGPMRLYTWMLTAHIMGDTSYDFEQNVERLQEAIKEFGVVIGVDHYFELKRKH